jgi:hypothetical protein
VADSTDEGLVKVIVDLPDDASVGQNQCGPSPWVPSFTSCATPRGMRTTFTLEMSSERLPRTWRCSGLVALAFARVARFARSPRRSTPHC